MATRSVDLVDITIEDSVVERALRELSSARLNAAVRRGVTKSARDGNRLLKSQTRSSYHRVSGNLFSSRALKPVRVHKEAGGFAASLGYSSAGFYGRFLSAGTGDRVQKSTGRNTGALKGSGVVPRVTSVVDRRTPGFITTAVAEEIRKTGLA